MSARAEMLFEGGNAMRARRVGQKRSVMGDAVSIVVEEQGGERRKRVGESVVESLGEHIRPQRVRCVERREREGRKLIRQVCMKSLFGGVMLSALP